jgi:hypothetical protein
MRFINQFSLAGTARCAVSRRRAWHQAMAANLSFWPANEFNFSFRSATRVPAMKICKNPFEFAAAALCPAPFFEQPEQNRTEHHF